MSTPGLKAFRTLTPHPVVEDAPGLIDFVKDIFGGEVIFRRVSSPGGVLCRMRIGDSFLMIGGGGFDLRWIREAHPMAFHVYVPDRDATYQRALQAGAAPIRAFADQLGGKRSADIRDPFGNNWYIATRKGETWFYEDLPIVQPYLHPLHAEPLIGFLNRVFGAKEEGRAVSPINGQILHTTLRIGDASLEISEADGPYQPMPGTFSIYVPDVDTAYDVALESGATSISAPADQPYGYRGASVNDACGNRWYMTQVGGPIDNRPQVGNLPH
jgi:PhnB protein